MVQKRSEKPKKVKISKKQQETYDAYAQLSKNKKGGGKK